MSGDGDSNLDETGAGASAPRPQDEISTVRPASAPTPSISGDALTLPGPLEATDPGTFDGAPDHAASYRPGARIGGFVVDRELGQGAMGMVVLAHDPELDRPVAIKLLRRDYAGPTAMARMTREAQSIAKITHPNVVAVHQVGTHLDQLFIVMEYVDGGTLRQWSESAERTVAETIDAYVQAGRGLQAAHDVGLVHRDFKPDNVLMGSDGRVRVTDFGLVGAAGERSADASGTLQSNPTDIRLTRTGSVMGTPAYMSAEQHRGETVDARSDQFSFCVALYEALWGQRPFAGKTLAELAANVAGGRMRPPPPDDVPRAIREAIAIGLCPDVEGRHPSMAALLARLQPAASPWPRWPVWVGAATVVVAASVGAFVLGTRRAGPDIECPDPVARFEPAWGPAPRQAVADGFAATGHALAGDTFARLDEQMTAYASQWSAAWTAGCDAVRRGETTPVLHELRASCLDELRDDAGAFAELLASDAERLLDGALSSVTLLRSASTCDDLEALQARPRPSPEQQSRLDPLRPEIVRARVLLLSGRHHDVLELTRELEPKLREVGFGSALAEDLVVMARAEMQVGENDRAEEHLREAITLAAEARAHSVEARALGTLVFVVGGNLGRIEEAVGMLPAARAAARRSGDPRAHSYVASAAGVIYHRARRFEDATAAFDEAIAVLEGMDRPPPDELGMAYSNRAGLEMATGQEEASLADYQKGLDIIGDGLGRKHPFFGGLSMSLGMTLVGRNQLDEAMRKYEDARLAWETVYGKDHSTCANLLVHTSKVLQKRHQWGQARAMLLDALGRHERFGVEDYQGRFFILDNLLHVELREGLYDEALARARELDELIVANEGPSAERRVANEQWRAMIHRARGDLPAAIEAMQHARAIAIERTGPKHAQVAARSADLGELEREAGHCDAASALFSTALRTRNDLELPPDATLAQLLAGMGSCELRQRAITSAAESIERAVALIEELGLEGELVARIRLAEAELRRAQGDVKAAHIAVARARVALDGLGPSHDVMRARIDASPAARG